MYYFGAERNTRLVIHNRVYEYAIGHGAQRVGTLFWICEVRGGPDQKGQSQSGKQRIRGGQGDAILS